jgi:exodeoxyribonuclease-3
MRIVSWNINSIRARLQRVEAWLDRYEPDVLLLQETKCSDEAFPRAPFAARGFEVAALGGASRLSGYNGVAIASRVGISAVQQGLPARHLAALRARVEPDWNPAWVDEPRMLTARCGGVRVSSVYAPNGRAVDHAHFRYKLAWFEALAAWMGTPGRSTALVAGDMNVAPTDEDVWNPKGWRGRTHVSPEERARVTAILSQGWLDAWETACGPAAVGRRAARQRLGDRRDGGGECSDGEAPAAPVRFTWWNYRPGCYTKDQGLRIDLAFASPLLARRLTGAWVDRAERGRDRPSDHAPLVLDLDDGPGGGGKDSAEADQVEVGDEQQDAGEHAEHVPQLVVAEPPGAETRDLEEEQHRAHRVQQATGHHQAQHQGTVDERREHQEAHPAEDEVERAADLAVALECSHLEHDAAQRARPHDGEQRPAPGAADGEEADRRERPRDEQEDRAVVAPLEHPLQPAGPRDAVVEGARQVGDR